MTLGMGTLNSSPLVTHFSSLRCQFISLFCSSTYLLPFFASPGPSSSTLPVTLQLCMLQPFASQLLLPGWGLAGRLGNLPVPFSENQNKEVALKAEQPPPSPQFVFPWVLPPLLRVGAALGSACVRSICFIICKPCGFTSWEGCLCQPSGSPLCSARHYGLLPSLALACF